MKIGRKLKNAREASGLTLQDLERRTKISRRDLIAIEQGRFNFHSNPVYVRSYIRSYANAVGENPQIILNQLHKEQGTAPHIERSDPNQNARQFSSAASKNVKRMNRHEQTYHSEREPVADGEFAYEPKRRSRSQHHPRTTREFDRRSMRPSELTASEEKKRERLSGHEESYSRRSRRRGTKKSLFAKVYTLFLIIGAILLVIASIGFIWFRMMNA